MRAAAPTLRIQQLLLLSLLLVASTTAAPTPTTTKANDKNNDVGRAELAAAVARAPPLLRASQAAAVPRSDRASVEYGGADPTWRQMRGLTTEWPPHYTEEAKGVRETQRLLWPDGYAALCTCVRDQRRDLRYWIEYHAWLGVEKFYIFDHNSTRPLAPGLSDYLRTGLVELQAFKGRPRRLPSFLDTNQWRAYQACIEQHRGRHRWMGFLDVDEFIVFDMEAPVFGGGKRRGGGAAQRAEGRHDGGDGGDRAGRAAATAKMLLLEAPSSSSGDQPPHHRHNGAASEGLWPLYLHHHEKWNASSSSSSSPSSSSSVGGVALNWVLYGSGGLASRPKGRGPLRSFSQCAPRDHRESRHFKVAAVHTGHVLAMGGTPHSVVLKPKAPPVVDALGREVKGPLTVNDEGKEEGLLPAWSPVALHHYAIKSRAEFLAKEARGTGASNRKDAGYWAYAEGLASSGTCAWARPVGEAFEQGVVAGGLGGGIGGADVVERPEWYPAWEEVERRACGGGGAGVAAKASASSSAAAAHSSSSSSSSPAPMPGTPEYYSDRASGVVPLMPDDWLDAKRVRRCFLGGGGGGEEDDDEARLQAATAALEEAVAAAAMGGGTRVAGGSPHPPARARRRG